MKLTFLGTGTSQGVPVIACDCQVCQSKDMHDKRLRSSVMIETNEHCIVIDAGPDFRAQMLRAGVKRIDALLVTHGHKDHIGGLDDIRGFNYVMKKPVDVYATATVSKDIHRDFYYAFADEKYPGVPDMNIHFIEDEAFYIDQLKIQPIPVMHHRLPVMGYRIGSLAYITDCSSISPDSMKLLENLDVLVINALRIKPHISHFNLDQALELAEILKPRKTYLTHISHKLGLHEDVKKILPHNVQQAYDGLVCSLNDDYSGENVV
ncbi:MAG: MBL fold metallo-hydrolase [Bacteroidales bacterium]|nr:MBL fold metallo-hydrolase [Bacteroidales bacterium]